MGSGSAVTTVNQVGQIANQQADRTALNAQNQSLQGLASNGSPLVQAQLQQATNNNVANSAGILASAKGINPAMAAREGAYNAANTQQQSAGQAAQTQGQIQLGAQNQLSSNLNNEFNQDTSTNNQQNALNQENNQFNANQTLGIFKSTMSAIGGAAMGGANGGMVPKMAGGGMMPSSPLSSLGTTDSRQGDTTNTAALDNQAAPGVLQAQNPYAQVASFFSGLSSNGNAGANSQAGQMMNGQSSGPPMTEAPQSSVNPDEAAAGMTDPSNATAADSSAPPTGDSSDMSGLMGDFAKGGRVKKKVPAMVSPGEVYLKPGQAKQVAKGKANPIKAGEKIPGEPKVPGNSYANDVVPKKLDAGGVVIPNSVMQSSDPAHNAYKFVQAVMVKNRAKGKH